MTGTELDPNGTHPRVFWQVMVSLDGRYAGPNGELDWHVVDEAFTECVLAMLDSIDTILFGRRTLEELAGYWPHATSPEAPRMNELEKVVFSSSLSEASWNNSRIVRGSAVDEVLRLREHGEGRLAVFGSNRLAGGLLQAGLIDEVRVLSCPIVLGAGPVLLDGLAERVALKLKGSRTLPSGVMILSYAPEAPDD